MDELIKLLYENLEYIRHDLINDTINIYVISNRKDVVCPFCDQISTKVHSRYILSFQDLPIQGKKVNIILNNRKMFCSNSMCENKTFAETFDFLPNRADRIQGPSLAHWFGTDLYGRDIFARVVYGSRVSLSIGIYSNHIYGYRRSFSCYCCIFWW